MTPHILGLVTETRGTFFCGKCAAVIEMVAIIDRRRPMARIWRESSKVPHECLSSHGEDLRRVVVGRAVAAKLEAVVRELRSGEFDAARLAGVLEEMRTP